MTTQTPQPVCDQCGGTEDTTAPLFTWFARAMGPRRTAYLRACSEECNRALRQRTVGNWVDKRRPRKVFD